jgi:hypothetical protein
MISRIWLPLLLSANPMADPIPADITPKPEVKQVETLDVAFSRFLAIVEKNEHTSTAWKEQSAAAKALVAFGQPAANSLMRLAEDDERAFVRKAAYYWLRDAFPTDPWVLVTIVRPGLNDSDTGIRYECAFHLGEHKAYGAFRELRQAMKAATDSDALYVRLAAAKSLAQLGEADVLPILYDALGSDSYMPRMMANSGIKALTGKNLNDFGYQYGEGAFVSGGKEAVSLQIDGIGDAEKKANRFRALADWCKWLKAAHPEYYKHIDTGL